MANIKGLISQLSVSKGSDGDYKYVRMLREGSLSIADFKFVSVMAGRGHMINVGAFSTPITGGGDGTVVDQDQPEFVISAPSGTTIIPLRIEVTCQTPLINADSDEAEIIVAVDQDNAYAGDGTATSETIYNMNTLNTTNPSACTAISAATADITDPVLDLELMHKVIVGDVQGTAANALWGELYGLYEPAAPPILNGPCMICGYWGGTVATTGFAVVQWLEYPTTWFS